MPTQDPTLELTQELTQAPVATDTKPDDSTVTDDDSKSTNLLTPSKKKIKWSPENEMILVEWCDAAQCYKWLHSRSHSNYSTANAWFTIPAIVLSTISGTASFAQTSLPPNYATLAPVAIGSLNIFIGILTTIQQYLKIAELNEAHRVMSIAWDKYARNIRIELSKAPDERSDASGFLKHTRQEFDRLMETSPYINQKVIDAFISTFKGREGTPARKRYEGLKKPDICNIIVSANEARHHWYKDAEQYKHMCEMHAPDDEGITTRAKALQEKEHDIIESDIKKQRTRASFKHTVDLVAAQYKEDVGKINEYIKSFYTLYSRQPLSEEISTYVLTYMEGIITEDSLDAFLLDYEIQGENNV